jgi:hypothetical protein
MKRYTVDTAFKNRNPIKNTQNKHKSLNDKEVVTEIVIEKGKVSTLQAIEKSPQYSAL